MPRHAMPVERKWKMSKQKCVGYWQNDSKSAINTLTSIKDNKVTVVWTCSGNDENAIKLSYVTVAIKPATSAIQLFTPAERTSGVILIDI